VTDIHMPKWTDSSSPNEFGEPGDLRSPVVVVTSLDGKRTSARPPAGVNAYLVKSSFDQRVLIQTIETLLGGRFAAIGRR